MKKSKTNLVASDGRQNYTPNASHASSELDCLYSTSKHELTGLDSTGMYTLLLGTPAGPYIDGGKVDRTALKAWRDTRRQNLPWGRQPPPALVHLIDRSSQLSGTDDIAATGVMLLGPSFHTCPDLPLQNKD